MGAPQWQKIAYGTLVAAGLATTGTVIWFTTRDHVEAIDMLEILQGTQERCFATRNAYISGLASNVYSAINWTPDTVNTGYFYRTYDTNGNVTTNQYLMNGGTNTVVVYYTNEAGSFLVTPIGISPRLYNPLTAYPFEVGRYLILEDEWGDPIFSEGIARSNSYIFRENAIEPYMSTRTLAMIDDALILDRAGSGTEMREKCLAPKWGTIAENSMPYAKHWAATNGEFTNYQWNIPRIDQTSLWDHAGVGYVSNGNSYFSDTYYLGEDTNPPVWYIKKTNLTERYKALYDLKWTVHESPYSWTADGTTNSYSGWGASSVSLAHAFYVCSTNMVGTNENAPPEMWTYSLVGGPVHWSVRALARRSKILVTGIETQLSGTADFYVRTFIPWAVWIKSDSWMKPLDGTNTFDANGFPIIQDRLSRFSVTNFSGSSNLISDWLGSTDFPSFSGMAGNTGNQWQGFAVEAASTVLKWNFQYCTNQLP